MPSSEKGRYEMNWDCPGCGTTGLLGLSHRHCPNCGAPQDPSRRYFPPEGTEVAVEDHPYQGVDVTCPACDTPNAAKATFCVGCGSPLDGAKAVRQRDEQAAAGGKFAEDSASSAAREAEAARQKARAAEAAAHGAASGAKPPPSGGGGGVFKGLALFGCLGVGALVLAAIAVFFLWKKEAALVVTGHAWERTIAVEMYAPATDSAWRDQVPAGAYELSCREAQRDTKKVPDGEVCTDKRKDQGDGTFVVVQDCKPKYREEPVYDQKCSYKVDRWQVSRTERAGGAGLAPAPSWPTVSLVRPGTCLGCEREGARKETYTVKLQDSASQKEHGCDVAEARWRGMAVGSRWKGEVGVVSGLLDCDALAASP